MKPTIILKPRTQPYVEEKNGYCYRVIGTEGDSFRVVDEEEPSGHRLIPSENARYFSSVLEFLKESRIFDIYRDEETREIKIREMCDQAFETRLTREEVEGLAHELLIFAWTIKVQPNVTQ